MADDGYGFIWNAVSEAVESIIHLEVECDRNKLEKRIRDHFSKAAKGLSFNRKFEDVVNDYADQAFGGLFVGLGDRDWLVQADFLLVLDAAVKDYFPKNMIQRIPQLKFEQTILAAHDRAFDEQRYTQASWAIVSDHVQGKKTQKSVREAIDESRQEVVLQGFGSAAEFIEYWITGAITRLAHKGDGDPSFVLPMDSAVQIFDNMMQTGGLPQSYVEAEGQPQAGDPFIAQVVEAAYAQSGAAPAPRKAKGKGKGKFSPY
jgi:ActR/RegA family two-component response regulator